MHTIYGIWIDHREAFIVESNLLGEMTVKRLSSQVEPKNHGGETFEHLTIVNQKQHEERRGNEMHTFCKEIIAELKNPDEILVFGPGTAKHDLANAIKDIKALADKLKEVETADHLTEAELKEFVKKSFGLPRA